MIKLKYQKIFEIPQMPLSIYIDKNSSLYYKTTTKQIQSIYQLPWKLQLPFYLTFLHNNSLAEKFKDLEIIGAINIYIKAKYFMGEKLYLDGLDKVA